MKTYPGLTPEKYKELVSILGSEEAAAAFLATVAQTDKAARDTGVTYKADPTAMPPAVAAALTRLRATMGDAEAAAALQQLAEQAELKQREAARATTKARRPSLADGVMLALKRQRPG